MLTMAYEHGDPHAGLGSPAGRLSGADGRGLRSRRRALPIVVGTASHRGSSSFPGLALPFQGRLDDAIAECKCAIELDPEFGNPYNDIGAYLIEQNRFDEAIPWLERAVEASRYEPRHFPPYNF